MATLASVVARQRQSGKGVVGSLTGGIKEKLKEKFDPRRMLNQNGLMTSLFPSLRAYKAKGANSPDSVGLSPSLDVSALQSSFNRIDTNTRIEAKNSMVFPMMHRDMNIFRQNIVKLVKLKGETPATKADRFFMSAKDREKSYEAQVEKSKPTKQEPETKEKKKNSYGLLITAGVILTGGLILKELDILTTETIKKAFDNLITVLTGSSSAQAAINLFPNDENLDVLNQSTFRNLTREQQDALLKAQAQGEGANKEGTLPNRMNNPGAIIIKQGGKIPEYAKQQGAELGDSNSVGVMLKFPSRKKGEAAQRANWEKNYSDMKISDALSVWVTGKSGNKTSYDSIVSDALKKSGVMPRISSGFGSRVHPVTGEVHEHTGVDIASPVGTPVMATKSGKISRVGPNGNYGNMIEIDHGDGTKSLYAHLSAMSVRVNEMVNEGQKIGEVGATGRVTGPHLHYEVIKNGKKVDPLKNALSSTNPISSVSLLASNPKFNGQAINNTSAEVLSDDSINGLFNGIFNINNNNVNVMALNEKSKDFFDGFSLLFGAAK